MTKRIVPLLAAALFVCVSAGQSVVAGSLTEYRHLILDGHTLKWGAPTLGIGATVTYAIADGERSFAGARNCGAIDAPDGMLAENGVSRETFENELVAAFKTWERVADLNFVRVDAATADILIGAQVAPRGRAFTNVEFPPVEMASASLDRESAVPPVNSISAAVICLNPEHRWKVGFDGNLDVYDLGYTLEHEIGHAIGLDHPGAHGALMGFAYQERFRSLQTGDIAGIVSLYGPARLLQATAIRIDSPVVPANVERAIR